MVVTAHDVESFAGEYSDHAARRILTRVDKVIAHNSVSRRELIAKANLPVANIEIIPHGNYLNTIPKSPSPAKARKKLNLPLKDPVLLFFGQIKEVKGLDLLLQALPQVIAKFPTLRLLIAGKVWKDDFTKYANLIKEKNLQNNVDLHIGYILDGDVAAFYRSADLVILPYRRIYQSGVLLMAMSYGLPVMVSNIEGMVEIIQDNINGFIFKTGDVESLSSKIIEVLNEPDRRKRIAKHGFETVVLNHDWKTIGEKTVGLYRDIH
jgi:glycosyltransferase involved in cell wall biosynthesis